MKYMWNYKKKDIQIKWNKCEIKKKDILIKWNECEIKDNNEGRQSNKMKQMWNKRQEWRKTIK